MAQSNGDELEKILEGMYHAAHTDGLNNIFKPEPKVKRYKALILADRKQHELDARIDELISYGREVGLLDLRVKTALHERIEKLKAEREGL